MFRRRRADFRQKRLNLVVFIELTCLLLKDQIISHTAGRKIPNALLVFTSVGMGVKVSWALVRFFKQFNQKEKVLDRLGSEAKVLIKTRSFLIVEIDVKQLTGFDCLCDNVIEV